MAAVKDKYSVMEGTKRTLQVLPLPDFVIDSACLSPKLRPNKDFLSTSTRSPPCSRNVAEGAQIEQYPALQGWIQGVVLDCIFISLLNHTQQLQGIEDAVLRNIQAVSELSDLVRTSFGPNGALFDCLYLRRMLTGTVGRNKLIINHLGRLFVTSDAATIIREVEVIHPAAKLLVMASQAQEAEVRSLF